MNFDIKNRVITGDDSLIIGDNADYVAEFTFDEEWNGITKTARFISCSGSYVDKILEDDKCCIPCEVLKCGYCRVGVYSSEKTTTKCKFFVTKSVKNDTGCVCEPTPDVYGQLTGKLDNIQQQMPNEVEKQVGEYLEEHKEEFKGEKGDRGEAGSIKYIPVNELPTENIDLSATYLLKLEEPSEQNKYKEYVNINNAWECIGTAKVDIDLSGYVTTEEYNKLVNNETQIKTSNDSFIAGGSDTIDSNAVRTCVSIGYDSKATKPGVCIGNTSKVTGTGVSIGNYSNSEHGVALGNSAKSKASNVQLLNGENSIAGTLQIKNDNIYDTNTHTLTVQNIEQNGNSVYGILSGETAPTTDTTGSVGQFYLDTTEKKLYQCTAIADSVYTWQEVGGSVDTSNLVTKEDFDKLVNNKTQIKNVDGGFSAGGGKVKKGITIGYNATINTADANGVAIGYNSEAGYGGAVGSGAKAGSGFAGGRNAVIANLSGSQLRIDAIQLGAGTNSNGKSLQIYDDNIYNANTHTLTVQNIELNGVDLGTQLGDLNTALETILGV